MTPEHEASRTLVKSPPELWAELSDPASLCKHLGDFGGIRITRLEPETAVAWEGERVSGTVRLEPSGWGTRVVLTAQAVPDAQARLPVPPAPSPPTPLPPRPWPDPVPPTPSPDPGPPVPGPGPAPTPTRDPAPLPPAAKERRGFLGRVLRFLGPQHGTESPAIREPPQPTADAPVPEPEPTETSEPEPELPPSATEATLVAALDSLGQAHHRPFSRA